jgi:hypothetical protein
LGECLRAMNARDGNPDDLTRSARRRCLVETDLNVPPEPCIRHLVENGRSSFRLGRFHRGNLRLVASRNPRIPGRVRLLRIAVPGKQKECGLDALAGKSFPHGSLVEYCGAGVDSGYKFLQLAADDSLLSKEIQGWIWSGAMGELPTVSQRVVVLHQVREYQQRAIGRIAGLAQNGSQPQLPGGGGDFGEPSEKQTGGKIDASTLLNAFQPEGNRKCSGTQFQSGVSSA